MNKNLKVLFYVILDIITVSGVWMIAILLTGGDVRLALEDKGLYFYLGGIVFTCVINAIFGLYSKLFRYVDFNDAAKLTLASVFESLYFIATAIFSEELGVKWVVIVSLLYFFIFACVRFAYKLFYLLSSLSRLNTIKATGKRIMVIGAGNAGSTIIHEMKSSDKISDCYPVCVLDDDELKIGQDINGVKIVGKVSEVKRYAKEYNVEEIILAIPSASRKKKSEVIKYCQDTGCKVKVIPGVYQFLTGNVSVSDAKEVEVADLLGREPVKVNTEEIIGYIKNKVVMVTGGGGSIGSELCRQIASHNPKQLIIVDIYENNAYEIQQELVRKYKDKLNLKVLIASVRNAKRIDSIFEQYKPNIVFHAAAHKHVPLMEESPNEAIKNNVGGTYNVADAAGRFGVKKFILISTDKAVNPTNVMGATKRICEMIIQTLDKKYDTEYGAVRFGNVLGSNGSVIPLFRKQIAEGGPVTVTHKDIVRYFMTIPEAVSLVLQAGAYAKGGEIFVLDMGDQVRIYDLAVNLIKLSGYTPFKDIDIEITGLRPGEKLYEERLMDEEGLAKTANDIISVGKPIVFDQKNLFKNIKKLTSEAYNETNEIKEMVATIVPTYKIDKRNGKKKTTKSNAKNEAVKSNAKKKETKVAVKKETVKPTAKKTTVKNTVKKTIKPTVKKTAVKPTVKTAVVKPAVKKTAQKTTVNKTTTKKTTKTATKTTAKPVAKKGTVKVPSNKVRAVKKNTTKSKK